jgi:beta-lactamase class A
MYRRDVFVIGAAASLSTLASAASVSATAPPDVLASIKNFSALSGTASCLVVCDSPNARWQGGSQPDAVLFVGSAVKTFILAQTLISAEQGRLSENDQWVIDDSVRSLVSPVFLNLSGKTQARSVLEAMIAHSDNTATDVALGNVGVGNVRALIANAGCNQTRIPDSTRRLFLYIAGAPPGSDLGWQDVQKMSTGWLPGPPRPVVNTQQSMLSSATDLVQWYRDSLTGKFFTKPGSLMEYKRILSMADVIPLIVPDDTVAFAKGGSIDWQNFHCYCVAGQMVLGAARVSFCFTINWNGPDSTVPKMFADYTDSLKAVLAAAAESVRR